jgi:flagellar hook-associated protein 3 FlgL
VATDLKGYGGGAENLTAAQSLLSRTQGYIANTKVLGSRLSTQDYALTQVGDASQSARDAIAHAVATNSGTGLADQLESLFDQAVGALNTQFNGSYLFSGGQDVKPVQADGMSDLTDPTGGAVFKDGSYVPTSRLDDHTTLQTGFTASGVGKTLFDAFKQAQTFLQGSDGKLSDALTPSQASALTAMLDTFDKATAGVTQATARNGQLQQQAENSLDAQKDRESSLEGVVGGYTDVDMAKAISDLTQAQTAVQASAEVFATLKDVSLLNYLR